MDRTGQDVGHRIYPSLIFFWAALALASTPVHAQEKEAEKTAEKYNAIEGEAPPPETGAPAADSSTTGHSLIDDPEIRDWIYGGIDLGYARVGVANSRRESDKTGFHFNAKLLYSKYIARWVFDLGGGWMYHKVDGEDRNSPLANPVVNVITRAALVEFSPRYRINRRWQIGPVFNFVFGEDVSFDETTRIENDGMNVLLGPRIQYELPIGKGRWRFGAQALTDLAIENRQIWSFQADVQYGIPLSFMKKREEPVPPPEPVAPVRPQAPKFAEVTPERAVKIYLGEAILRFGTNRSDLRPSSRDILSKVSEYLKKYDGAWKSMRVEGHSDRRGKVAYNEKLALRRAGSVKNELQKLGIPRERVEVKGYGPHRPIDPADDLEAYALNRRVEIWLDGVTDPEAISRDLNDLNEVD